MRYSENIGRVHGSAEALLRARIAALDTEIAWRKDTLAQRERMVADDRADINAMVGERASLARAVREL
ncbi:hypothetical protein SEA_STINSON_73 [Mycobacterium phage Stinson]|uniref:Uncharacterized protein n=1 Tax=Mycobacterium phage Murucutumbu TaxID=1560286 RepID=A0A0A0RUA9_9CAUD|nr:hypothetical protein AVV71_gp28 [Mycobacterium phage Murucutumbu]AIW03059.1 hypothetical protein MURUCUTUMBU_73 [Mycobacterium phage Murucutumbu]QWK51405.1 hypothetical protein SEA_STINSON_73 [Mycobacterium phage Stinson]WNO27555.1 hypothetical protein SEA_AGEOFDAPAGE_76 [Mycobacterium phage Ageofdapage]